MLGAPHPNEQHSVALQSAVCREGLLQDARITRLLWTGFGFAVITLIGLSACALRPVAPHASAEPSRHAPTVAFYPSQPGRGATGIMLPAVMGISGRLEALSKEHDQDIMQGGVEDGLGKIFASLQTSGLLMTDRRESGSTVVARPETTKQSQLSVIDRARVESARAQLERQFAPPSPPPSPPPDDGDGDRGGDGNGDVYLRRFSLSEAGTLLDDWISILQINSPAHVGNWGAASSHEESLQQLQSFRSFVGPTASTVGADDPPTIEEYVLYGLYNQRNNIPLAIVGGRAIPVDTVYPSDRGTLDVRYISVNPVIEQKASIVVLETMENILLVLAEHLVLALVSDNVNK